jgi:hypothetical protein
MPDQGIQVSEEFIHQHVPPHGRFRSLAAAMNKDEDLVIVRRFGDLNMLHLLTLQTELDQLRLSFLQACEDDEEPQKTGIFRYLAEDPAHKHSSSESDLKREQRAALRKELGHKIRTTLNEYSETCISAYI